MVVLSGCVGSDLDADLDAAPLEEEEVVDEEAGLEDEGEDAALDETEAPYCDAESIGEDSGAIVSAIAVDDGDLVGQCLGETDERLVAAWEELTAIAPLDELADVDIIAGFDEPDGDTLAFAGMLGDTNDSFVVAVNLASAADDPEELRLTLAHEMSHVFAQTPDQLDIDLDPSECDTFHNGNGCFYGDAYVTLWIEAFWTQEQLDSMPDPTATDEEGGEDRCTLVPSFLGTYAATHPEEDLAESFSAFVFSLPVPDAVQPKLDFFEDYPELVAFRELVESEGVPTPPNNFDECG